MGDETYHSPHVHNIVDRSEWALEQEHEARQRALDDLRVEAYTDWHELNARIDKLEAKVDRLIATIEKLGAIDMDDLK